MKKVSSKKYIMNNKGFYSASGVEAIPCINEKITLEKLFQDLPFEDFAKGFEAVNEYVFRRLLIN